MVGFWCCCEEVGTTCDLGKWFDDFSDRPTTEPTYIDFNDLENTLPNFVNPDPEYLYGSFLRCIYIQPWYDNVGAWFEIEHELWFTNDNTLSNYQHTANSMAFSLASVVMNLTPEFNNDYVRFTLSAANSPFGSKTVHGQVPAVLLGPPGFPPPPSELKTTVALRATWMNEDGDVEVLLRTPINLQIVLTRAEIESTVNEFDTRGYGHPEVHWFGGGGDAANVPAIKQIKLTSSWNP